MPASAHPRQVATLRLESERRLALLTTSIIFIPNALAFVVDRRIAGDPTQLAWLFGIRMAMFAMWGAGLVFLWRITTRTALQRVVFALCLGLTASMIAIQLARPAGDELALRTSVLASVLLFVAYPNRLAFQLIPWGLLVGGTMATTIWRGPAMLRLVDVSLLIQFLLAGVLGALVSLNRRTLEQDMSTSLDRERAAIEEKERTVAELRTLEGILPICSYCRKIRTDVGDWHGLERYVSAHTSAEFSHGICPACAAQHLPEFFPTVGSAR